MEHSIFLLIAAIGGGTISTVVTEWFRHRKTGAETKELSAKSVDIITKTAVDLVERSTLLANAREAKLEAKVDRLERKIDHLTLVVDSLTDQLEEQGIEPVIPAEKDSA